MAQRKRCLACGKARQEALFLPFENEIPAEEVLVCVMCRVRLEIEEEHKAKAREEKRVSGEEFLKNLEASDPVNSPDHYRTGGIECIDAMVQVFGEEAVRTYARINAFKYIWRHQYKGKPEEDLAKAAWYTRFANGDDPRKEVAK